MRAFQTQDAHEPVRIADCVRQLGALAAEVWTVSVSRSLRQLLRIRELEEEQARLQLESAQGELRRLERALEAGAQWDRRGRGQVDSSARTGELADRLSGLEDSRAAARLRAALAPRIADGELDVAALREDFLARRVERRQAETLIEEAAARDAIDAARRSQQALDDWHGARRHRKAALEDQQAQPSSANSAEADETWEKSRINAPQAARNGKLTRFVTVL
jgi:flagellar export protein FliJ